MPSDNSSSSWTSVNVKGANLVYDPNFRRSDFRPSSSHGAAQAPPLAGTTSSTTSSSAQSLHPPPLGQTQAQSSTSTAGTTHGAHGTRPSHGAPNESHQQCSVDKEGRKWVPYFDLKDPPSGLVRIPGFEWVGSTHRDKTGVAKKTS